MHCSRGERWHNRRGSGVTVSSGWKQNVGDVNEAAKTAARMDSKIRKEKSSVKDLQDGLNTHKEPGMEHACVTSVTSDQTDFSGSH